MTKRYNWNQLRDWAHQTSVKHGFYEDKPSNIHFLCLIVSELMEAVEADRINKRTTIPPGDKYSDLIFSSDNPLFKANFELYIKNTLEDELADVVIRCLDLAGANCVEISIGATLQIEGATFTEKIWYLVWVLANKNFVLSTKLNLTVRGCLQIAWEYGIDLLWHIEKKMMYNSLREKKHGKRY